MNSVVWHCILTMKFISNTAYLSLHITKCSTCSKCVQNMVGCNKIMLLANISLNTKEKPNTIGLSLQVYSPPQPKHSQTNPLELHKYLSTNSTADFKHIETLYTSEQLPETHGSICEHFHCTSWPASIVLLGEGPHISLCLSGQTASA